MRNDVAAHAVFRDLVDGERDAVERDRAFGRNESGKLRWHLDGEAAAVAIGADVEDTRDAVDVARYDVPADLACFIVPKGSVALDGISLTVNEVAENRMGCNIIPHTLTHTTLSAKKPGDALNLEVDVFARYVVRAMELWR